MASDTDPLVGPLGQPCKVYVEHAGAERIAPGQEQMIKGVGGIVVEDPNQASVVVVIKRGAESIEQRIRDTCIYRKTSPWTQGVVDGLWVADCIHQSKLLGPPEWGGHLYRPTLESVITQDEADAAAFSVFGRPIDEPEHEEDTEEPNSMQLDPVPAAPVIAAPVPVVAGGSGSNPQNSEESSIGVTSATAGDVPVAPSNGGTTQGPRTRSSKNKRSQKSKDSFLEAWIKVEKIVEDPKKKGWFGTFSTSAVLSLIDELCELGATDSEPASTWWEEFTARNPSRNVKTRAHPHTADEWRELYRDRKGMINKCVNMLLIARSASGPDSLRPLQGHPASRTSRYEKRRHSGRRTLNQNFEESDLLTILTDTSSDFSDDELQLISLTTEPVVQPRKGGRPPQKAANNQGGRLPQTPQQGEKPGVVALPKRVRIKPTNGTQVLKQLSNRNEAYTNADYDEVADYIRKQIQTMNPPEREVVAVLTQDSVWKAFGTMYLTDRNWKEWQNYYRERADDINRTARLRLKRAEPSVSQVAAEIEQLVASGLSPPNGILKRSLEGSSDERRNPLAALCTNLHTTANVELTVIEKAERPPIRIFILGARSESNLPLDLWHQIGCLFPSSAFHIYIIGPQASIPTNATRSPEPSPSPSKTGYEPPILSLNSTVSNTVIIVDGLWVADCIHRSKLLGPPEWGGHLYRPALESVITQDEADAAAFSVFGRPTHEPEHEKDREEPNSMQLDPVPVAGGSGSDPQNNTSKESSIGVTPSSAGDIPVPPSNGGTTQERRTSSSKKKGLQKPKDDFQETWIKVEKIVEDPKKKGWFGPFSASSVLDLIDELCASGASMDSEPALSWWEEFTQRHAREWDMAIRPREPRVTKIEAIRTDELYTKSSHAQKVTPSCLAKGDDLPKRQSTIKQDVRHKHPNKGTKLEYGMLAMALPKSLHINVTNGVLKQLSNRNEDYTDADYDEVADYIGKLIQALNLHEREVVAVMTQDPVWKGFVAVFLTDRNWKEWQNYYREIADDINRTARVRLKREKPSVSQLDAEIENYLPLGCTTPLLRMASQSGLLKDHQMNGVQSTQDYWGGHLFRPTQEVITIDEADTTTVPIFGHIYGTEHEEDTGEPEAMQLDPVPVAGPSGNTPQNDTSEELPRGASSSSARDVPMPPAIDGGVTQGRRTRSSKNKESPKGKVSWEDASEEVRKIVEDPRNKTWFGNFSTKEILDLVDELYRCEATTESILTKEWWDGFVQSRAAKSTEGRRHSTKAWRECYSKTSKIVNGCVHKLLAARPTSGLDGLGPPEDHSASRAEPSRSGNRSAEGALDQNDEASDGQTIRAETSPDFSVGERPPISSTVEFEPAVQPRKRGRPPQKAANNQEGGLPQTLQQGEETATATRLKRLRIIRTSETQAPTVVPEPPITVDDAQYIYQAMRFFVNRSDSELLRQEPPRWKDPLDAFMDRRFSPDPMQLSGLEESTWRKLAQDNWDIISTGALALKGKAFSDDRKQLSNRNEDYTDADYDEAADYIAKQIQVRKLPEGGVTAVMMQDFVWKAFVIVYLTDRNWNDWQNYYRGKANNINRTARVRLMSEELHASRPPNGASKRSLEGSSDGRRPKYPRL
ncbi:translational activator for mitochondrial COX1 [Tulasnella sp. 424]|nr:translational activator for mitochondrial COX1 [Tulasnella sp. 424]